METKSTSNLPSKVQRVRYAGTIVHLESIISLLKDGIWGKVIHFTIIIMIQKTLKIYYVIVKFTCCKLFLGDNNMFTSIFCITILYLIIIPVY